MNASVAVVIPTYNEAGNIGELLTSLRETLGQEGFRIIVIDDGSADGTADIVERFGATNVTLIKRRGMRGIGSAFLSGIRLALLSPDCRLIVTMDADLSHNPHEVPRLLQAARYADLVQGSRYVPEGKTEGWSWYRQLISRAANHVLSFALGTGVRDHTGSFRVLSRPLAECLASLEMPLGYEFLPMTTFLARREGYRLVEVPITFTNRHAGASKLKFRTTIKWLFMMAVVCVRYGVLRNGHVPVTLARDQQSMGNPEGDQG